MEDSTLGLLISPEDLCLLIVSVITGSFAVASLGCLVTARAKHKAYNNQKKMEESPGEFVVSQLEDDVAFVKSIRRVELAKEITALISILSFLVLLLGFVMFDRLPIAAGIVLMYLIASSIYLYYVPRQKRRVNVWWKDIIIAVVDKARQSPRKMGLGLLGILVVVLALNIGLEGTCSANLQIVSTRISRKYMQPTCVPGRPCYIYLTLPKDYSTAVIVNHHTTPPISGPMEGVIAPTLVRYDVISRNNSKEYQFYAQGFVSRVPDLEVERDIHWTHLTSLTPNTTYFFIAGPGYDNEGNEVWSEEFKFRTSNNDDSPYTFVAGGDMGNNTAVGKLSTLAAAQEPLFALVGGDLAYEYAQATCYRAVDSWLGNWMLRMRTPLGYTIPLLSAVGNHEVYAGYLSSPDQVPFYIRYFPHMDAAVDPGVHVDQRKTYHEHLIGNNTLILALDSGHVAPPSGTQASWIDEQLSSAGAIQYKFVTYHVPMYPTIRPYSTAQSALVRDAWMNIFDNCAVTISFENHDHAYKRTYPLRGGQKNSNGTLYLGDGAWGHDTRPLPADTLRWYQSFAKATQYILRVDVSPEELYFRAFDVEGELFDSFWR